MALADLFTALRPSLSKIRDRGGEINHEIAELERERVALLTAPLPFDDFRAYVLEQLEHQAQQGMRQFATLFTPRAQNPSSLSRFLQALPADYGTLESASAVFDPTTSFDLPLLQPLFPHLQVGPMSQVTLCALLAPEVKAGVMRILDELAKPKWPREVGLPRAARLAKGTELDARIGALVDERQRIHAAILEAAEQLNREAPST